MGWLDDQCYYRQYLSYIVKFYSVVCNAHAYQVIVYKLVQHCVRTYAVKP